MVQLDAALPYIFLELPFMTLALLVVVAVEYFFIRHKFPVNFWAVLLANVISTFAGIPLSNVARALVALLLDKTVGDPGHVFAYTIQTSWRASSMVATLAVVLIFVFDFLISFWLENLFLRWRNPQFDRKAFRKRVFFANLLTYVLIAAFLSISLLMSW